MPFSTGTVKIHAPTQKTKDNTLNTSSSSLRTLQIRLSTQKTKGNTLSTETLK